MKLTLQQEELYLAEVAPLLAKLEGDVSAYRAEGWSVAKGAVEVQPQRDGKHQVVAALHLSRPLPDQKNTPPAPGRASSGGAQAVEQQHACRTATGTGTGRHAGTLAQGERLAAIARPRLRRCPPTRTKVIGRTGDTKETMKEY
ncbi:hypothetical protein [Cupriavidus sp. TMH.W2]|uniref:hypothetical protein n=1 Tax=Cupriavidus sp. TMH.W2 TaxID=3434465 RepID=UPI003D780BE8